MGGRESFGEGLNDWRRMKGSIASSDIGCRACRTLDSSPLAKQRLHRTKARAEKKSAFSRHLRLSRHATRGQLSAQKTHHQSGAKRKGRHRSHTSSGSSLFQILSINKVTRKKFDEGSIEQDAGRDGIQGADCEQRAARVGVQVSADADADCDADGAGRMT